MGGDHYCWGKEVYFDQSFHIPLIIRDPRRAADRNRGRQVDRFTESVDILPTILEWLGQPIPAQCDGRSLMPFLEGATPPDWRTDVHYELDFRTSPNSGSIDPEAALGHSAGRVLSDGPARRALQVRAFRRRCRRCCSISRTIPTR